jgi:hypothetical protein
MKHRLWIMIFGMLSLTPSQAQWLGGEAPGASAAPGPYACVPMHRDARNPYALAILSGIQTTILPGTAYQRMDDCTQAMDSVRPTPQSPLLCTSRDRDGRGPWILGMIQDGRHVRFDRAVSTSLGACIKMSQDLIISDDGRSGIYCSSKNGSGLGPFAIMGVDLETGQVQIGGSYFSELSKCNRNLGISN